MTSIERTTGGVPKTRLQILSLAALGIVFGDIGTSPLYTFKTILDMTGRTPDASTILGALSLVLWTLFIVTTVKYVSFAMRVDNDGEGGILALMSLLGVKKHQRPAIVAIGLFGAALIYGDGAITPAISVLSALEGLDMATSAFRPYIVTMAVTILLALFAIQSQGTSRIGQAFGPVMFVWFAVMAVMGIWGIAQYPAVMAALDPHYGLAYLFTNGISGFLVLGGVFLCVTGAEALYADMGHFGRGPIRLSWFAIVFPSLILNYAGQAALVLRRRADLRQHLLSAVPAAIADTARRSRDRGDDHRQPIHHHRGVFHDPAGDSAGLDAAVTDQADLVAGLWSDLCRHRQLRAHGRDDRTDGRLRQIRESGRRVWRRRVAHHADDVGPSLHRDARDLGLELDRRGKRRGIFSRRSTAPSSSPISPKSPREDMSRFFSRSPSMA